MKIQFAFTGRTTGLTATVEDSIENCASLLCALGEPRPMSNQDPNPDDGLASTGPSSSEDVWVPRSNRRKQVLETIQELKQEGVEAPSLGQIKHRFARLFPEESLDNLDQVVRDMANKTSKLERLERGTFKLTE